MKKILEFNFMISIFGILLIFRSKLYIVFLYQEIPIHTNACKPEIKKKEFISNYRFTQNLCLSRNRVILSSIHVLTEVQLIVL